MTYTMHWRSRSSPDNRGTGLEVKDWKEATAICLEHNTLYPEFTHWAEKKEPDGTNEGSVHALP